MWWTMNEAMKPDVSLTLFEFLPYCKASVTLYVSLGFTWPDYLFGPDFLRGNPGHFLLCELLPGKYVHFIFHLCSGQNKISWSKIPSSHLEKWKSEETASWISQRYDRNAFKENITYLFFLYDELQFMTEQIQPDSLQHRLQPSEVSPWKQNWQLVLAAWQLARPPAHKTKTKWCAWCVNSQLWLLTTTFWKLSGKVQSCRWPPHWMYVHSQMCIISKACLRSWCCCWTDCHDVV